MPWLSWTTHWGNHDVCSISSVSSRPCWFALILHFQHLQTPCVWIFFSRRKCILLCVWHLPEGMLAQHRVLIRCGDRRVWGTGRWQKGVYKMPSCAHIHKFIFWSTQTRCVLQGQSEVVEGKKQQQTAHQLLVFTQGKEYCCVEHLLEQSTQFSNCFFFFFLKSPFSKDASVAWVKIREICSR